MPNPKLPPPPIIYLITSGETNPASEDFERLRTLCEAAVAARVSLIQLREKNLSARSLFELSVGLARLTRGSDTRLLVNDRADIARAAGADGVHLTTRSLDPLIVRRAFGDDFLIGVSTHSLAEARAARDLGAADFATFGPVFDTPSKRAYGPPVGPDRLREAARSLVPFPLVALGGITRANAREALRAGAYGIAAIRLFDDAHALQEIVSTIRSGGGYDQVVS
ncbi:MAG TPA: thiamine phosphate synthase [Pyrinomonadaceae bacterium]|jgi:thiamine-phosphate pyrophosphorylase|nr:thiamine phosphate synthase [Pyrinomonadaceae bacterium]